MITLGFRPHEGDPSSLPEWVEKYESENNDFRPHEGDPSSLPARKKLKRFSLQFPSPRRGPIFSTTAIPVVNNYVYFRPHEGDPSSLPYSMPLNDFIEQDFRPHEGDPSSLPGKQFILS